MGFELLCGSAFVLLDEIRLKSGNIGTYIIELEIAGEGIR